MTLKLDKVSGLYLPKKFIEEKTSLKNSINEWVERTVRENQYRNYPYFLTFHAKFDEQDPTVFTIDAPKITTVLPPFLSNSFVWYVNNIQGFNELLWMVAPKKRGEKLKVEFNKSGVAYLQAKGAMPS